MIWVYQVAYAQTEQGGINISGCTGSCCSPPFNSDGRYWCSGVNSAVSWTPALMPAADPLALFGPSKFGSKRFRGLSFIIISKLYMVSNRRCLAHSEFLFLKLGKPIGAGLRYVAVPASSSAIEFRLCTDQLQADEDIYLSEFQLVVYP